MLITENMLDEWIRSHEEDAKGVIVDLVRRLVTVSCPTPDERRFPASDSFGQHGPDGYLNTPTPYPPYIPIGRSFWEIGTNNDPARKANDDYRELTAAVREEVRKDSVFIFVTPRSAWKKWEFTWKKQGQSLWLYRHRIKKEWKDIQIIDGTILVDWLDKFPSVALWFAQKIRSITPGQIEIPQQHWEIVKSIGEPPPLIPDLFLANREEACSKLKEIVSGTTVQLKLTTYFPDQIVNFVTAYLFSLDPETQSEVLGRTLIVYGIDGWNFICDRSEWKNHILVADSSLDLSGENGTKLIQKARKAGHAIIFGGPYGGIPDPASAPLRVPLPHQIQDALKKAGYGEERARTLALQSGGNLSFLLRCIQNLSLLPAWAEKSDASELAIALLLGSWNENTNGDKQATENLSGKAYGEWISGMREIALQPSTPLIQFDGKWKFTSRYEAWYALGPKIFDEHLDRLKAVTISILREKDPKFELSPNERFAAAIHGKVLPHSEILRKGLSETLALLGGHPKALTSCAINKAETSALLAVREILDKADWIQWASLNDMLPLFAEASPDEFLAAVEKALERTPSPIDELFAQEGDGIFGGNYLTGLLWALETIAWDPEYLNRAVICLGELATHDPGGHSGNRPINSLTSILLPWFPQTCAPTAKRVSVVNTLLSEFPEIGWKLLLSLLPQQHSHSFGTRRPAWRKIIPDDWRDGVSIAEYWVQIDAYSELAIEHSKKDNSKLVELIGLLERLPPPACKQLLSHLNSEVVLALPKEEKSSIWNMLTDLVVRHRKFSDAEWAMKSPQIDEISAIAERLAPDTPFLLHQRLFSERYMNLLEGKGEIKKQMEDLKNRQQSALKEVAASEGMEAVLAFAQAVESPWRVGIAFGSIAEINIDNSILPALLVSENKSLAQFVGGFIWGRYHQQGWEWVDKVNTSDWTQNENAKFFSFLPFTQEAWQRVEKVLGEEQASYWENVPVNPYDAKTGLDYGIEKLIQYGRPYQAINCLSKILYEKQPMDSKLAIRALLEALKSSDKPNSMGLHDAVDVIKALQDNSQIDPDDLFKIEWAYLPLLDDHHDATPKLLWHRLANDPAFFSEVIRAVYRSRKEKDTNKEIPEEKKQIAKNAYQLLSEWHKPPGLRDDGSYDGDALNVWVDAVTKECSETGHLETAMTMIGHVLRYAPSDSDGLWIHRSVAKVLNGKGAKDMRIGFHSELYNSRGVHWVDPSGKQEMELAAENRKRANEVESAGYPRLAATLRDIANEYEHEAERIVSRKLMDED